MSLVSSPLVSLQKRTARCRTVVRRGLAEFQGILEELELPNFQGFMESTRLIEGLELEQWMLQFAGLLEGLELEQLIALGAISTLAFVSQPKSAPGPSNVALDNEKRARRDVLLAMERLENATPDRIAEADAALQQAQQRLSVVEEEIRKANEDLQAYPVPQYLELAYAEKKVMVAVTGASGVGKSTWINAIRRMSARDLRGARTGVTETTKSPQMFTFNPDQAGIFRTIYTNGSAQVRDKSEHTLIQTGDRLLLQGMESEINGQVAEVIKAIGDMQWEVELSDGKRRIINPDQVTGILADCVIWDLPGVGTPDFPSETYLRNMGIRHYDIVVLVTASRFTQAELMLVEELKRWSVPFFLVRAKIDIDVQAEVDELEESEGVELGERRRRLIEAQTITKIKDFFGAHHGLQQVYCISARVAHRSRSEFLQLERDMEAAIKSQRLVKRAIEHPLGTMWAKRY